MIQPTTAMRKKETPGSPPDPWMTLVEASTALGWTRLKVLSRSIKGELEARHIAGRTLVSRASVERVLAAAPPKK